MRMIGSLAVIGGGKMASALLAGAARKRLWDAAKVPVAEKNTARHEHWTKLGHPVYMNTAKLPDCRAYLLCVKPQDVGIACAELSGGRDLSGSCVISIAAGVRVARLAAMLGTAKIVRAMPNTPAAVGEGCAFAYTANAAGNDRATVEKLFSSCGTFSWIDDESLIDTATALSGSGPAYIFLMIEAMTAAAVDMGMERGLALGAATQTVLGAAIFARDSGIAPEKLRVDVTSPGGTTECALKILSERGFAHSIGEAMRIARDRARELSGNPCT